MHDDSSQDSSFYTIRLPSKARRTPKDVQALTHFVGLPGNERLIDVLMADGVSLNPSDVTSALQRTVRGGTDEGLKRLASHFRLGGHTLPTTLMESMYEKEGFSNDPAEGEPRKIYAHKMAPYLDRLAFLKELGVNLNEMDRQGETAAFTLARFGCPKTIERARTLGVDFGVRDRMGYGLAKEAIRSNFPDTFRLLHEAGARFDDEHLQNGNMIGHAFVLFNCRASLIPILASMPGVDFLKPNRAGQTPLTLALNQAHHYAQIIRDGAGDYSQDIIRNETYAARFRDIEISRQGSNPEMRRWLEKTPMRPLDGRNSSFYGFDR